MEQKLPELLNYSQLKPVGYPSQVKYIKFTPQSFSRNGTNEIIRFNIDTSGFWDPYSAYIELEIDTEDMNDVGTLQIDGSASSFINELIINNQGTEIERIQEYDLLVNLLNDMHYSVEHRAAKRHEGFGFCEFSNLRNDASSVFAALRPLKAVEDYIVTKGRNALDNADEYSGAMGLYGFKPWLQKYQYESTTGWYGINSIYLQTNGSIRLARDDANVLLTEIKSIQANVAGVCQAIQRFDANLMNMNQTNSLPTSDQQIVLNKQHLVTNVQTSTDEIIHASPQYTGYYSTFTPSFSGSCFEPYFSKNYFQATTHKGKVCQATKITRQKFQIPICSGLLGVLMPKESYKYIPMSLLQDLQIELRMNPHAMFTSGYMDDTKISGTDGTTALSSLDINGTKALKLINNLDTALSSYAQQQRKWIINDISINVELHYFQPSVEQLITDNINNENGIVLHTQSWMLGPIYNFAEKESPNGTYSVNLGFESMKNVMIAFLPNDYLQYTFCRKQFRISHNITEMQFKIGQEFYPSEKVRGHGGIPRGVDANSSLYGNNSQFLIELYKAFGKFHDVKSDCFVNSANFAINERPYDPTNQTKMWGITGTNVGTYEFKLLNNDTANGLSLFHENRVVGKAVYCLNFETLNADLSVISGVNTMQSKPFEVIFRSDKLVFKDNVSGTSNSEASFPRTSSMFVFCNYDMLIQLKKSGLQVLGRG